MPRAVVFANGWVESIAAARSVLRDRDRIIAADGGCRWAMALGVAPEAVVGDMDSIPADARNWALAHGARFLDFPEKKNETDLELAILHAAGLGCSAALVIGALGGRIDHSLGNIGLLGAPAATALSLRFEDGLTEVFRIVGQAEILGRPGDLVSLIPEDREAEGVETEGLTYPLYGEVLHRTQTRGVSNRMADERAIVRVKKGALVCVHIRKG